MVMIYDVFTCQHQFLTPLLANSIDHVSIHLLNLLVSWELILSHHLIRLYVLVGIQSCCKGFFTKMTRYFTRSGMVIEDTATKSAISILVEYSVTV